jgi:GNAT superfamily N-acetyltransferase
MVLVAKIWRRRGIGTRLLRRCIEQVRSGGAVAGLDATELGRPVYLPLGFRDLYAISRWRLDRGINPSRRPAACLRPIEATDLPALAAFDELRSGMEREAVLRYLAAAAPNQAFLAEADGRVIGYALARPGRIATHIGSVVADDEEVAVALVNRSAAGLRPPIILDAPDAHRGMARWLAAQGAARERGFMRMVLGAAPDDLAHPAGVFALAGPELG